MAGDILYEKIPVLSRRVGDNVIASQNNSTLILGRDRLKGVGTGYGNDGGAGAAHIVVGRNGSDPSVVDDAATVYLSMKTDPDAQAGTSSVGSKVEGASAVIMRADCIRVSGRKDMKVSVGTASIRMMADGKIVIEGDIFLVDGAKDRAIRGDAFAEFWNTIVIPTPAGPSGPPPPIPEGVFSPRVRVG